MVVSFFVAFHLHLFTQVFCQLLRVWGDASSLRHVSAEQHLFLCRALIICISHVRQQEEKRWREGQCLLSFVFWGKQIVCTGVGGYMSAV